MRVVILDRHVLEAKVEHRLHLRAELQPGQRARLARQLQARLLQVIAVQMRIAQRVHEIADTQPAHLRDHVRKQRIAGDVERFSGHPD